MMQFISERLLEDQIKRIPKDEQDEFFISMCKKEFAVIQKLKVEGIDLTGSVEDVIKRIDQNSIYFMNHEEYMEMLNKSIKYDAIERIVGIK